MCSDPDNWGACQPHNSYNTSPPSISQTIQAENRLNNGSIVGPNVEVHGSWAHSPAEVDLTDSFMMLGRDALDESLAIQYAPKTSVEVDCGHYWHNNPVNVPLI